jgi:hypothetical protein
VIVPVAEHVAALELAPLHVFQIEAPYHCHVGDVVVICGYYVVSEVRCVCGEVKVREAKRLLDVRRGNYVW